MPSGTHRHLKRVAAPQSWGLAPTEGTFAVRPLPGGFPKSLSIPIKYIVERFLKAGHTAKEITYILKSKMIAINGREITNGKRTVGLFDVITVKKTNQHYRLIFNVQRKFKLHKISSEEAQFRLTKVTHKQTVEGVPYTSTIDGFNFRFVDPTVQVTDTVKVNIAENKIVGHLSFKAGNAVFVFGGSNQGRVGVIKRIEGLVNGDSNIYLEDANKKAFTVLQSRSIVIGDEKSNWMTLDETAGVRLDELERSDLRYAVKNEVDVEVN